MKEQNFKNHARYVPLYHGLAGLLIVAGWITTGLRFIHAFHDQNGRILTALLLALFTIAGLFFWFIRAFALRAQDRAIRAEENLRYFSLTGKLFDSKIRMGQIIALRFAPDEELIALTDQAIKENLSSADIKKSIKNWKGDYHRV